MKQRIVFRADASKRTGYGHFIRSLALAGYLKKDYECHFATYNEDYFCGMPTNYQLDEIIKICNPLAVIGESLQEFNEDFLKEVQHGDIVVLDNYYFDTVYQQSFRDKGCKLVCIDDMHQYHMVCDLLLTVSPLKREDFSLMDYTDFVGGIKWSFLREPFLSPCPVRNISHKINRIVMAMGGADAFNLTDKMITIVHNLLPNVILDVICGETVKISTDGGTKANIHRNLSAQQIVQLFDKADIGIFPASTICIEAFSRKLPVIAGYYVDNQKEFYNYGVENNYFASLGSILDDECTLMARLENILSGDWKLPPIIDFRKQKNKIVDLFKKLENK